jgi:hypothetical protein
MKDQTFGDHPKPTSHQNVTVVNWVKDLNTDLDTVANLESVQTRDMAQVEADLIRFKQLWGIYENIFVTDMKGVQTAAALGTRLDLSTRNYYKHAIHGETYVSSALASETSGPGMVVISEPMKINGQIVGTVGIICQPGVLTEGYLAGKPVRTAKI